VNQPAATGASTSESLENFSDDGLFTVGELQSGPATSVP
jgi:hypothetical protein